jgi:hypothetical protein
MSDTLDRIDALIAERLMGWHEGRDNIIGLREWHNNDGHRMAGGGAAWQPTRNDYHIAKVKREIERRGWWYRLEYRPPALNHDVCAKRDVLIDTMQGNAINALLDVDDMSEGEALCRAILAALGVEVPE